MQPRLRSVPQADAVDAKALPDVAAMAVSGHSPVRRIARRSLALILLAAASAIEMLQRECDEVVCLATPEPFVAVGLHYADFDQTTDEEVILLLRHTDAAAHERHRPRRAG
jgi:predicted phosphoribosyltransferase